VVYKKLEILKYTKLSFYLLFCMDVKLGGGHRLRVFENGVLRRIFGLKREESQEAGEYCIMRSFITCTLHHHGSENLKGRYH
jgi:hypothetical protein